MPFRCDLTVMCDGSAPLDRLPCAPHPGILGSASSNVDSARASCSASSSPSSPIGEADDGAVDGGAVVGVPPEHALFLGKDDAVGEGGAGLDEALRDVLRPVGPWVPRLVLAVPAR